MPPFHLTEQDLRLLNDADLRELVRRLCTADMAQRGLPVSAVRAGGAQEAADGGLDVVVHLPEPLKSPNFVPRAYTGFQVKKYSMTPAACRKEMQCGQRPKAVTAEIAAEGGAYIMVTADSCSDLMLKKRLASMKEAVQTLPDRDRLWLDFYGLDRLLQWLERHPGVELWARDRIGRPLFGCRSYGR